MISRKLLSLFVSFLSRTGQTGSGAHMAGGDTQSCPCTLALPCLVLSCLVLSGLAFVSSRHCLVSSLSHVSSRLCLVSSLSHLAFVSSRLCLVSSLSRLVFVSSRLCFVSSLSRLVLSLILSRLVLSSLSFCDLGFGHACIMPVDRHARSCHLTH